MAAVLSASEVLRDYPLTTSKLLGASPFLHLAYLPLLSAIPHVASARFHVAGCSPKLTSFLCERRSLSEHHVRVHVL